MNRMLMEQIVKHIFSNLGVTYSPFVNLEKTKSLTSKDFLLPEKLVFQDSDGKDIQNRVWGCQILLDQSELKMVLGDCSQGPDLPEYCLIVQLKNAPAYGLYLVYSDHLPKEDQVDSEATMPLPLMVKIGWNAELIYKPPF